MSKESTAQMKERRDRFLLHPDIPEEFKFILRDTLAGISYVRETVEVRTGSSEVHYLRGIYMRFTFKDGRIVDIETDIKDAKFSDRARESRFLCEGLIYDCVNQSWRDIINKKFPSASERSKELDSEARNFALAFAREELQPNSDSGYGNGLYGSKVSEIEEAELCRRLEVGDIVVISVGNSGWSGSPRVEKGVISDVVFEDGTRYAKVRYLSSSGRKVTVKRHWTDILTKRDILDDSDIESLF